MRVKIKSYEFVEVDSITFDVPEEVTYLYYGFDKIFIKVEPGYDALNKLCSVNITEISNYTYLNIKKSHIWISELDNIDVLEKSKTHSHTFLYRWVKGYYDVITEEQFNSKLKECIRQLTIDINTNG